MGVDLAVFRPDVRRWAVRPAGDRPVRRQPRTGQGPGLALRVFAALAGDRPGLRLEVIGDGRLRGDLERLAGQLGVGDRISFLGQLPRAEMPARYRAATLLLVTSRHEGQSMVAVEAAASGIPVVGTRVGVLPDLGSGALTVPVGDEAALVAAAAISARRPGTRDRDGRGRPVGRGRPLRPRPDQRRPDGALRDAGQPAPRCLVRAMTVCTWRARATGSGTSP